MFSINVKNIYEWPLSRRLLVLGLICAVTFYFGYLWDLSPLKQNLDNITQQENDLKQQLGMNIVKEKKLELELSKLTELKNTLQQWQNKINRHAQLPELLNEVLKIGSNNHLHFALFSPAQEVWVNDFIKTPIKVIAVGNYHQLADFISQVANMKLIVVIQNFTISNENKNDVLGSKLAKEANEQNLLTAEIMLDVFNVPEKAELENKPKPVKKEKIVPAAKPDTPAAPKNPNEI